MKTMAILCIGDELLDGRVTDANGRYLMEASARRPWAVQQMHIIADDEATIADHLAALSGVDLVVVSGGLGPTSDDVTRQGAAQLLDVPLIENSNEVARLRSRFAARDRRFTENNRRQCTFPKGAKVLATEVGTAAGFTFTHDDTDYYFFPGVRREFRWYVDRYLPDAVEDDDAIQRRYAFFGLGESDLADRLADVESLAKNRGVRVGFRASFPVVEVSLKGPRKACDALAEALLAALGPWLVSEQGQVVAERLGKALGEVGATVAVAESCTAGLLGATLTEVAGSSAYFREGYLTYSNDAKTRLLGVDADTLAAHGAVSAATAGEMAQGARAASGCDYALAITGIAGPSGGTEAKPVGTVHFGLATTQGVYRYADCFAGFDRGQVRQLAVYRAMALLIWHLEGRLDAHNIDGPHQL